MEIDVEIINRVKKGNKEAYGIIVKKYMKKAYFVALSRFYAILRNLCLNFVKRKKVIPMIPLEEANQSDPALCQKDHREDMKEIVSKAISSLSYEERELILLKYFQEYSYKEMAQILNCPVGTIMSRLEIKRKSGEVF